MGTHRAHSPSSPPVFPVSGFSFEGNALLNLNCRFRFCAILWLAVLPLAGCIAHAPSSSQPQQVSVTVTPSSENFVPVSGTFQFTATVTGSSNTGVTWGLQPNLGCNVSGAGLGAISASGLYTAPSTIPISPCAVVVTATANADATAQFQTLIYVQVAVAITTLPPQNQVATNANFQFAATVTGNSSQEASVVQWQVISANGGTIIASSGLYSAPSAPISGVTITATSVFDTSARPPSGTATIDVVSGPGASAISVSPASASIPVGGTYQFTATELGVATPKLHWSVVGSGCGAGNVGMIGESGLYAAPPASAALAASPCQIQIKASSANGHSGSSFANLHVALAINGSSTNGSPNNAVAPTALGAGANWLYSATVTGADATHQGVIWSATTSSPGQCSFPAGQFQSSKPPYTNPYSGFYVAPLCVPSAPVTITATSEFDPIQSQSTTINVQKNDPLGTATASRMACPANIGGTTEATCYQLDVSCPGAAELTAYLKVNQPSGEPRGTVILAARGNGTYDVDPDFLESDGSTNSGLRIVDGLLNSAAANRGFTTVQVAFSRLDDPSEFSNGWLTGPGGPRLLACRYATVAQWIYTNIHNSNISAPMCAAGNGAGAAAIAYALTDYGQSDIFSMVEATSAPAMSRLDLACAPKSARVSGSKGQLLVDAETIDPNMIDGAYPAGEPFCSNAINGSGAQAPAGLFLSDSSRQLPEAPSLGQFVHIEDASQAIPSVPEGARQIVADIQQRCKLP
jgi:hypothetical protein